MIPKYRAWDKENNQMLFPDDTDKIYFEITEYGIVTYDMNMILPDCTFTNLDTVIMQSTGLKGYMDDSYDDSEEKDVFSGDVIDIFWEDWPAGFYQENHMVGVVSLDKTGTAWVIKNAKYSSDGESIPDEIDGMKISRSLPDEEDLAEVPLHGFDFSSDDITILGNIYEHTELLKVR